MKSSLIRNLISYGVSILSGGGIAYLYISLREFPAESAAENYRMLADAFTIPGLLFIMFGALLWAAGKGALDGIGYALGYALRALLPGGRFVKEGTFAEYLEEKKAKRKKAAAYSFLFFTGVAFLIVSGVFIYLFYKKG